MAIVKIYLASGYVNFEFSPGNIAQYAIRNDFLFQLTGGLYISIYTTSLTEFKTSQSEPYQIVRPTIWSDFQDQGGAPLGATPQEVLDFLNETITNGTGYKFVADTWNDLNAIAPPGSPGVALFDLAYVRTSQGSAWLPGPIGGTYYPEGAYLYDGVKWASNRNAIATEINSMLADLATKLEAVDIDTLAKINAILTTPDLIDTTDPRLNVPTATSPEAVAGIEPDLRQWSPLRIREAVRSHNYYKTRPDEIAGIPSVVAVNGVVNDQVIPFTVPGVHFLTQSGPPAPRTINGIVKPVGNENLIIELFNAGASTLTLTNNSVAAAVGNRFLLPANIVLPFTTSVRLMYFAVFQVWVPLNFR